MGEQCCARACNVILESFRHSMMKLFATRNSEDIRSSSASRSWGRRRLLVAREPLRIYFSWRLSYWRLERTFDSEVAFYRLAPASCTSVLNEREFFESSWFSSTKSGCQSRHPFQNGTRFECSRCAHGCRKSPVWCVYLREQWRWYKERRSTWYPVAGNDRAGSISDSTTAFNFSLGAGTGTSKDAIERIEGTSGILGRCTSMYILTQSITDQILSLYICQYNTRQFAPCSWRSCTLRKDAVS